MPEKELLIYTYSESDRLELLYFNGCICTEEIAYLNVYYEIKENVLYLYRKDNNERCGFSNIKGYKITERKIN